MPDEAPMGSQHMKSNKKEAHWGLMPQLPSVGWSDSNLTKSMGDGRDRGSGRRHGRGAMVPIGRNTFYASEFTESTDIQGRRTLDKPPRDDVASCWSGPKDTGLPGMPAPSAVRPQDAVFAGLAAAGREANGDFKDLGRFKQPYATHVSSANDFNKNAAC